MGFLDKKITNNYWDEKLNALEIVNDQSYIIETVSEQAISKEQLTYFKKLINGNEMVEFIVLLTVFNALLMRYFETTTVVYSLGTQNRIPLLFHTLSSSNKTLKSYLQAVIEEVKTVYKYRNYTKGLIQNIAFEKYTHFGFFLEEERPITAFPFSLRVKKSENEMKFLISYSDKFISKYTATHFLGNFIYWMQDLETILHQDIGKIEIVSKTEKNKICYGFNNSSINFNLDESIVQLFEKQEKKTPNAIALQYEENAITYKSLNEKANQLARYLVETKHISIDDFVGIKLERTPDLIIALLAVLKTGAAYVPIDVTYPKERIAFIENDSNCKFVIDTNTFKEFLLQKKQYSYENLQIQQDKNSLAYVIYTSGTTGDPKGVMITHLNVSAMLHWAMEEFKDDEIEVVCAVTSHCFDLSVFEIFYTLITGKKIRLLQNALDIGVHLEHDKNILINTVPSSIRAILNEGHSLENVTAINLAGEAFPVDIAEKLVNTDTIVRNLYGPSEDTTYSTIYKLKQETYESVPIGKAIANSQTYILDEYLEPVPIGVSGKLYLGGLGVTKGYLNQPELTREKFIKNPFKESEHLYDTGDIAKWLPDGNMVFLGRKDSQVKLRGYRIELEEIETTIRSCLDVIKEVVVLVNTAQNTEALVAYIVAETAIDTEMIQACLKESLPAYMIPRQYAILENMPLTPNGKIDKKKLVSTASVNLTKAKYVAPKTELEKTLVAIWEELLEIDGIGVTNTFFELGGHSLLVGVAINKIYKQLNKSISVKSFLEAPTILGIKEKLITKQYIPIPKSVDAAHYPLTTSQKRIWVLSQFESGNKAYNISGVVKLIGNVDIALIKETFKQLITRHEVLRTVFKTTTVGEVHQFIMPETEKMLDFESKVLEENDSTFIDNFIQQEQNVTFDLEKGPLLQIRLLQIGTTENVLALTIHHIISDGWSLELLISEFTETYNALYSQSTLQIDELTIQYKDYAVWLQSKLQEKSYKNSEEYWLSQFQGKLPVLTLPSFKKRPQVQTHHGKTKQYQFSTSFLEKLKHFSTENDATLFMTLLSGINTLFYRYTKQEDIIIGTPIAGRVHPDLENQLGLYLNTLAIRTQLNGDNSFSEVLLHQKEQLIAAYEHQNYPFDELVNKLNLKIDTSRSALFDVMVVLQNHQQLQNIQPKNSLQGISIEPYEIARKAAQFDISFTFLEKENLEVEVEFNTDIYDELLIDQIIGHYEKLMEVAIENTNEKIVDLNYITADEKVHLLQTFNDTEQIYEDISVVEVFEGQVNITPECIAVRSENSMLTYAELNAKANRLANYLIKTYKTTPNDLIGVYLERNELSIVALLGILKTGAAYVPIDLEYPKDRVTYIQKDSNCKLVLDATILFQFEAIKDQFSAENITITRSKNDLAYIIYTSGTTGNPKGVMISQGSFIDYVTTFKNYFKLTQEDKIMQQASIAFDTSIEEIFPILTSGGELIIQKDRNDVNVLLETCEKHQVSVLSTNPYVLQFLNEHETEYNLNFRAVISGGDVLKPSQVDKLYQKYNIYNTYGPTESTVCATYHKIDSITESFSIGRPIINRKVYIIDPISNQLQPIGVSGELCISGKGLAVGYINQETLTNEKFVQNPFVADEKMYKSGDLARWLPDGTIDFLGRIDRQVKLRGYRIELGEIEHTIIEFDKSIISTVVTIKEINNEEVLVVYFTTTKTIDKSELKDFVQQKLPEYMVPSFYVHIEKIPVTANGKIDYKALPEVAVHDIIRKVYTAPQNEIEEKLVTIWESILGIENIGTKDNFFELGGHSMKVIQLSNNLQKEFSYKMKIKDLYEKPTIQYLAMLINEEQNTNSEEVVERIII